MRFDDTLCTNVAQQEHRLRRLSNMLTRPASTEDDALAKRQLEKVVATLTDRVGELSKKQQETAAEKMKAKRRKLQGRDPQYRIRRSFAFGRR